MEVENGLVECYVTVRVIGIGQAGTALVLAGIVGWCVRWLTKAVDRGRAGL